MKMWKKLAVASKLLGWCFSNDLLQLQMLLGHDFAARKNNHGWARLQQDFENYSYKEGWIISAPNPIISNRDICLTIIT